MSNSIFEFSRFDKLFCEAFDNEKIVKYFSWFIPTPDDAFKKLKQITRLEQAITYISSKEKYVTHPLNHSSKELIISYPEMKFSSISEIIELQENMKSLETNSEILTKLLTYLTNFYKIQNDRYRFYNKDEKANEIKIQGEDFLSFLERNKNNKILNKWYLSLEDHFNQTIKEWDEEINFFNEFRNAGIAIFNDTHENIRLKAIGLTDLNYQDILRKIREQNKKGNNKGTLNIGDLSLNFKLQIKGYNISSENRPQLIQGNFSIYSGLDYIIEKFISPFKEIDYYLRFIYLTRENDIFTYPTFDNNSDSFFKVKKANPYFLKLENIKKIVTNEIDVKKNKPIVFFTGPNDSGKTTLLRTISLIYNLAYLGAKVPAHDCVISPIEGLDIYEPVRGNNSGTFKQNLSNLKTGLENAKTNNSFLYLIDEPIMGGTNLSAIKKAYFKFLQRVTNLSGPIFISTNHSDYLKEYDDTSKFEFYKINGNRKLIGGIGESEGEKIIREIDF